MLRLADIEKTYRSSGSEVHALKGISVSFRRSEFVSILGPSGCGKTTLLNVIGGLDHYDAGDLVILGRSTKDYSERDWDIYRNHRIGFIFQSYNLIPQENILQNVELALTIAGLEKEEREERATKALDRVGLEGLYKKHPNQLSGGQCQRVAIARALVNEPDILLADEPTGALDSVTSIQIMDLIREISKEKLVIMVTHNPDLAEKYSSRIISLKDGLIIGDTNPYSEAEEQAESIEAPNPALEKAKMSFWTAAKLSAKNLVAKLKRTVLTVIAASIGIVGTSAVLAVSQGVRGYIDSIQDDMLSGNPVYVARNSIDLSVLMNSMTDLQKREVVSSSIKDGKLDVDFMVEQLTSLSKSMIQNEIDEDYVRYVDQMPSEYYAALSKDYGIDVMNNLYTDAILRADETTDKQVSYSLRALMGYCQTILENAEDGKYASYASLVSSFSSSIGQTLDNTDYILDQYDIVDEGGKYATEENELILVLNHDRQTTDFMMTLLGFYSQEDFEVVLDYFLAKRDEKPISEELEGKMDALRTIAISRVKDKVFRYHKNDSIYTNQVDMEHPETMMTPFSYAYEEDPSWDDTVELKISCVLAPKENIRYGSLGAGLYYTKKFVDRFLTDGINSEIVDFLPTYRAMGSSLGADTDGYISVVTDALQAGILYDLPYYFHGTSGTSKRAVGSSAGFSGISSLNANHLGGSELPARISIYPNSFDDKYKVTDYLDAWNGDGEITLAADDVYSVPKTLKANERDSVKYNDNLEIIIEVVNSVITIITIALIAFTSLALLVSTVMIAIITYVSVMERVKEIGVIRALGGRKKDVSALFIAETFMIGGLSGIFGLLLTYLFELILNLTVGVKYSLGMIANLSPLTALIVLAVSILLTVVAGVIPAMSAAKKDPVVALRTE